MNVTSNNYSPGFCFTYIFTKSDLNENKMREKVNFMSLYKAFRVIIKSYLPVTFSRFRGFFNFLSAKGAVLRDFSLQLCFMNQLPWSPWQSRQNYFEFLRRLWQKTISLPSPNIEHLIKSIFRCRQLYNGVFGQTMEQLVYNFVFARTTGVLYIGSQSGVADS